MFTERGEADSSSGVVYTPLVLVVYATGDCEQYFISYLFTHFSDETEIFSITAIYFLLSRTQ
jgi:hypothetical protein